MISEDEGWRTKARLVMMPPGADIFASTAEALVNPVDCTGAQGAGLALAFKRRWAASARLFKNACARNGVALGRVFLADVSRSEGRRSVAIPALGCGEGRLDWNSVRPVLVGAGERMVSQGITVELYEPLAPRPGLAKARRRT